MIGPLLKAQLTAFLTKKLLESKTFVKGVESAHGTFSEMQESAYQALLKATQEGDKRFPEQEKPGEQEMPKEMNPDRPIKEQNDALLKFIERTKKDLAKKAKE